MKFNFLHVNPFRNRPKQSALSIHPPPPPNSIFNNVFTTRTIFIANSELFKFRILHDSILNITNRNVKERKRTN